MSGNSAWFATIRYVPDLVTEEFVNVGVLLVCPALDFCEVRSLPSFDTSKWKFRHQPGANGWFIRSAVDRLEHSLSQLDRYADPSDASLEWSKSKLANLRTALQNNIRLSRFSIVTTYNPKDTLTTIFHEYVKAPVTSDRKENVTRAVLRKRARHELSELSLFEKYPDRVFEGFKPPVATASLVDLAYRNGVFHMYQFIPFVGASSVLDEVNIFRSTVRDIREQAEDSRLREGRFTVLGYHLGGAGQYREVRHVLNQEQIELQDFESQLPKISRRIAHELGGALIL